MTWLPYFTAVIAGLCAVLGAVVGATIARGTVLKQIRHTKKHEKRSEVIPELYSKLLDIHFRLRMTLHVEDGQISYEAYSQESQIPSYFLPDPLERGIVIEEKLNELNRYFYLNRIWLDKGVDKKAEFVIAMLGENCMPYFLGLRLSRNRAAREESLEEMRNWINGEIPAVFSDLENECRKILDTES